MVGSHSLKEVACTLGYSLPSPMMKPFSSDVFLSSQSLFLTTAEILLLFTLLKMQIGDRSLERHI